MVDQPMSPLQGWFWTCVMLCLLAAVPGKVYRWLALLVVIPMFIVIIVVVL